MSGQQLGTAVGFVAGFFLPGGPQVWAAVGGLIGGAIDPTKIEGPHIGDGRQQSSNEGEPIAWVLGTAGWLQGNLVQVSEVREIKKEDDGKGGPVQVTYEARQDFCIMAAESCELRDSTIVGVLMVRQNGQIVYDMRPGANFGAENAKFLQHHVFYYGGEDQMPNPTMEAISGVGNTPAYRGVFSMIGFDVDLTPFGNAIPTYEFVLVGEGEAITDDVETYAPPVYGRFGNTDFPLVDPDSSYTLVGSRDVGAGVIEIFEGDTIAEIRAHFSAIGYNGIPAEIGVYLGYSASTDSTPGDRKISPVVAQDDVTHNTSVVLVYGQEEPSEWLDIDAADGCTFLPYVSPGQPAWYGFDDGRVGRIRNAASSPDPAFADFNNCTSLPPEEGDFPYIMGIYPLYIEARSRRKPPSEAPVGDPCALGVPVKLPDAPGFTIDCEGNVAPEAIYSEVSGSFLALQVEVVGDDDGREVFEKKTIGPILIDTDPDNVEAFWESAYDAAVIAGTMPAGLTYPDDYPQAVSEAYLATYETHSLETAPLSVATAIQRIVKRGGLLPDDIDTSDIDDMLEGFPIQADYNAADCIRPLLAYSAAYSAEYDGKIHFHPHGQAIEVTIDPQDFVEGSESSDEDTREQAVEFPRKIAVSYIDITQNYTVRPQYAYRSSPDVRAVGEETVQLPLCAFPDRAAKVADIAMKVAWARMQGTRKFSVPWIGYDAYLKLVAGMPMALDGQRRIANRITVEDDMLSIEAQYDRQTAYVSIATGVPAPAPTPPVSTIGGATLFAVINAPALRDQDDRLGVYCAAGGLLESWPGCRLEMSIDAGATWVTAIASMTQRSTIGYLVSGITDASYAGDDVTNVVSVKVHGGELNSITQTQYLNELNPAALVRPDGTAEIIQFRDANEIDAGRYDLAHLSRGRLGSETSAHSAGAQFVFLDSVYFLELPLAYRGRTILFRPTTFGSSPETSAVYSMVFSPAWSQLELAPAFLTHSRVGEELTLTVVPRHRFGTALDPVRSANMLNFQWHATDGTNVANVATGDPTTPISVAGWSSPVTVTVNMVNRFTGDGLLLEAEVEI